ncbi:MAG: molybdate ABC transporter substrate-binding protein [Pseudomonadales bacterium]
MWLKKTSLIAFLCAFTLCANLLHSAELHSAEKTADKTGPLSDSHLFNSTLSSSYPSKEIIYLAVAANFKSTLQQLVEAFLLQQPNTSQHQLKIISGSTGALFAQITQGAPFDIFFAADTVRPQLLIEKSYAKKATLYSYAYGQLALAFQANKKNICDKTINIHSTLIEFIDAFQSPSKPTLAIANPATAPYGLSANMLISTSEENFSRYRIVKGKNVLHAQQLLLNSNADLAIISAAQAQHSAMKNISYCLINPLLYPAIEQAMVIIQQDKRTDRHQQLIGEFFHFIKQEKAKSIITLNGYLINDN